MLEWHAGMQLPLVVRMIPPPVWSRQWRDGSQARVLHTAGRTRPACPALCCSARPADSQVGG